MENEVGYHDKDAITHFKEYNLREICREQKPDDEGRSKHNTNFEVVSFFCTDTCKLLVGGYDGPLDSKTKNYPCHWIASYNVLKLGPPVPSFDMNSKMKKPLATGQQVTLC